MASINNLNRIKSPCKDCPDRWVELQDNCHMHCDAWKLYEEQRNAEYDERLKMAELKHLCDKIDEDTFTRLKKRGNRRN